MKHNKHLTPLGRVCIALIILVAVAARLWALDRKPLMHDESLFAYYSYNMMENGRYTHIPMLHGPTLMLATGKMWWVGNKISDRFHINALRDSIGSGRTLVALVAMLGMAAGLALWPRRYRWWLAPLLLSSPILLYYSRFFRDDMMVSATYLLATLGVARALGGTPRWRPLWAVLGGCFILVPLGLMESALFFQAAGVTFAVVALASRWLWRGPSLSLRLRPRKPLRVYSAAPERMPDKATRRRRRKEIQQDNAFASVIAAAPPRVGAPETAETEFDPAAAQAPAQSARPGRQGVFRNLLGWVAGLALGTLFLMFVYGVTFDPTNPPDPAAGATYAKASTMMRPLLAAPLNMKASWDYWKDQHQQHRIEGAIHYHLPILLTYELPLLLLLAAGLAWDAAARRQRMEIYALFTGGWLFIWGVWRAISYKFFFVLDPASNPHNPPQWLKHVTDFLHIEPNMSMLVLGLMIAPLLAWSILALREKRVLGAWLGWWAACSLFQYSSAGEKVPWLAIHMTLPLYMALGWLWAPHLRRMSQEGLAVAIVLMVASTTIAMNADSHLIGDRAASPRERLVYNHTPVDFDRLCRDKVREWETLAGAKAEGEVGASKQTPLKERNVLLVGETGWPGVWYFRHCKYQLLPTAPEELASNTDLIMGNEDLMQPLVDKLDRSRWKIYVPKELSTPEYRFRAGKFSLRDHWLAPWPLEVYPMQPPLKEGEKQTIAGWILNAWDKTAYSITSWWDYYWFRKPWTEPGYFNIVAIEPVKTRE